jgi:hypothetical protein
MHNQKNTDPSEFPRKIKNSRDFKREQDRLEYEANKKVALTTPRPIDKDLSLREIGRLRIQILYCPSFEPWLMWDIREKQENGKQNFEVYENELESLTTILPGYKRLSTDDATVNNLVDGINSTRITLQLDSTWHHGLDGTLYGLTIYNDLQREIRLRWWGDSPIELAQLDKTLKTTIDILKKVEGKINVG